MPPKRKAKEGNDVVETPKRPAKRLLQRDLDEEQKKTKRQKLEEQRISYLTQRVKFNERLLKSNSSLDNHPFVITSINANGWFFDVTLEGNDARGVLIRRKRKISMASDLSAEFDFVDEEIETQPIDIVSLDLCSKSDFHIEQEVFKEVWESQALPLSTVSTAFRLNAQSVINVNPIMWADLPTDKKERARAQLQAMYALSSGKMEVWKGITTENEHFATKSVAVKSTMSRLLSTDRTRQGYIEGTISPPFSRGGSVELDGWQIRLAAEIRYQLKYPYETIEEVSILNVPHVGKLQGFTTRKTYQLTVVSAEPGTGKTRFAVLAAFDCYCIVLAPKSTLDHWKTECKNVGTEALILGNGGKTLNYTLEHLKERPKTTLILTRDNYLRHCSRLEPPELLIVDEFHHPLCKTFLEYSRWVADSPPSTSMLGITGEKLDYDQVQELCDQMEVSADEILAVTRRVPRLSGIFPQAVFVKLQHRLRRGEKATWLASAGLPAAQRYRLLIFYSQEESSNLLNGQNYEENLWDHIILKLNTAMKHVREDDIAKIIRRSNQFTVRDKVIASLKEELCPEIMERIIKEADKERYEGNSPYSLKQALGLSDDALKKYRLISSGYVHLRNELSRNLVNSEKECSVCWENTTEWSISSCGHYTCSDCAKHVSTSCPVCRNTTPTWRCGAEVLQELQEKRNDETEPDLEDFNTSSKLHEMSKIIRDLNPEEKVLIISPEEEIKNIISEMQKLDIKLEPLIGSGVEQERLLKRWKKGDAKGLVCPPAKEGVDLNMCSAIILLTPLIDLSDQEYRQTIRRVIRRGSICLKQNKPVKVFILIASQTDEDNDEILNRMEAITMETN